MKLVIDISEEVYKKAKETHDVMCDSVWLGIKNGTPLSESEDCISRQAAIDAVERFIHELGIKDEPYNYSEMALSPQNVPTFTLAEKAGQWIEDDDDYEYFWRCSKCNKRSDVRWQYCPNCGQLKMQYAVRKRSW